MPFVFAQAEDEGDERNDDPPLEQYQYIPPPAFGGAPEPVHFSLEPAAPEPAPPQPQPRSILDILPGSVLPRRHGGRRSSP